MPSMTQLVIRPGRNAAREVKRIKEVKKVRLAIQWHEKERKKRQEIAQERWDAKQAVLQRIKWENEHVKGVRKKALRDAEEDWKLGPLRPNRAIGDNAAKYGALTAQQVQKPSIPIKTQENRNKVREKKGLPLEYPLVVDENLYFPIVAEDRVLLLTGSDKGRIGVVKEVLPRTHEIIVEGLNKQFYDSSVFGAAGATMGPTVKNEVPLSFADVRLVVPYEMMTPQGLVYKDAVVEKVFMERHTTGIDPFTGKDYGDATIPEDHQYDPDTGLPIFHRYVAGTDQRIEWPWERETDSQTNDVAMDKSGSQKSLISRAFHTLRHPITSLKGWRAGPKGDGPENSGAELSEVEKKERFRLKEEERLRTTIPRSHDPKLQGAYDEDTTRNIVEGAESMAYTLIAPPFPDSLADELRGHKISNPALKETRDGDDGPRQPKIKKRSTKDSPILRAVAQKNKLVVDSMKTPTQLHWEVEQAKKLRKQKEQPLVKPQALLMALGQHMQANMATMRNTR